MVILYTNVDRICGRYGQGHVTMGNDHPIHFIIYINTLPVIRLFCWLCWYLSITWLLMQLAGVAWKHDLYPTSSLLYLLCICLSLRKPFNFEPNRIETVVKLVVMYMRIMIVMNRGIPETNFRSLASAVRSFSFSPHFFYLCFFFLLTRFDFMVWAIFNAMAFIGMEKIRLTVKCYKMFKLTKNAECG